MRDVDKNGLWINVSADEGKLEPIKNMFPGLTSRIVSNTRFPVVKGTVLCMLIFAVGAAADESKIPEVSQELLEPEERKAVQQLLAQIELLKQETENKQTNAVEQYLNQLNEMEDDLAGKEELESILVVREEKEAWEGGGAPPMLDKSDEHMPRQLPILRKKLDRYLENVKATGHARLVEVGEEARERLEQMEKFLTRKKRIEAAYHLREIRSSLDLPTRSETADQGSRKGLFAPSPSYVRGIRIYEYPRHESQVEGHAWVMPPDLGEPLDDYRVNTLNPIQVKSGRNGVARGFIKIEKPGEYVFASHAYYSRRTLKVNGEWLYEKGNVTGLRRIVLPTGMIPVMAIVYVHGKSHMNLRWQPPGQTELSSIPKELLYYDNNYEP